MNRVRNLSEQTKKKLPNSLKSNKSKRNSFSRSLYPSKRSMSNTKNNQLKELILRKIRENKVKGLKDLEVKVQQIYIKKGKKVPSNLYSVIVTNVKQLKKEGRIDLKGGTKLVFLSNFIKKNPSSLKRSMSKNNLSRSRAGNGKSA